MESTPRFPPPGRGLGVLAACSIAIALIASAGLEASSAAGRDTREVVVAGTLPVTTAQIDSWCWSGAWVYPVGDPTSFAAPGTNGAPGYAVLRTVQRDRAGAVTHQGVDLGNRQGGGAVRAAACGVVAASGDVGGRGYGEHVVLAHRLEDGAIVYTVYAHLAPGSISVHEGEAVPAGWEIGRVGHTGRATTDHLHFEVRRPADPESPWERAHVEDPIGFVADRLLVPCDSSWAATCLAWAQCSALVKRSSSAGPTLPRAAWWHMLARAVRDPIDVPPVEAKATGRYLAKLGVVKRSKHRPATGVVGWRELEGDLHRLARIGIRVPQCPGLVQASSARPSRSHRKPPALADACFALAEIATEAPQVAATP